MGRLFWQPEELSKSPGIRININVFPLCIIHLNFINTGQDSKYLSLEHCSVFSWTDTQSSSQRLPIVSGPGSPQHPGPICIPDETFHCRGSPRSSDPLFSSQQCYPTLGYRVKHWPHNINPHIKYRIRLRKAHHNAAVPLIGVKVRPTS